MTKTAVVGGTGQVGRAVVARLRAAGHESVEISRSGGVDVLSGHGLAEALNGVEVVIDVLNTAETDPAAASAFFTRTSEQILQAEEAAGVRHHVLLSIVNVDQVPDNGHYVGKVAQERTVKVGSVPCTILRATQFHSFAGMVAGWTTHDNTATVAPLLVQPVAVEDVAEALVALVAESPSGQTHELAGPDTQDLVDMARRTLAVRGDQTQVRASWQDNPFGVSMAGEVLLPGPDARRATTTFEEWLTDQVGPRSLAETYYDAWMAQDFDRLRAVLAGDVTFRGPLGTADGIEECLEGLRGMRTMMTAVDVDRMVVEGHDVITWYQLHTEDAGAIPTVNWMHVRDNRIARIRVTFDPRPILPK